MTQLQSYNYSQSLTSVTVLEGLQGTSNLHDYSLASATVPPTASKQQYLLRDVIHLDDNPSTVYNIVTHRSQLQIIQTLIQFEFFLRSVSFCLSLTTYLVVNSFTAIS